MAAEGLLDTPTEGEESAPEEKLEWLSKLEAVKAREKAFADGWWKSADRAVTLYNNEKEDKANPYNILYSNTEVLKPSLYSATPKPDVRGRFVENPVSPLTKLVEHLLIVFSDPSNPGEESLDDSMGEAVTSTLVAGLGFIRLKHYPDRAFPICPEVGHWKGLIWAAGRKWSKLPWIAFRHELTREEFFSTFKIKAPEQQAALKEFDKEDVEQDEKTGVTHRPAYVVYEYWDKEEREIYFLCEQWEKVLVKEEPDTLKLKEFFPTPGLLLTTKKPGRLIPTPLYDYYQDQALELNRVTARLNKVISAIKVRGGYNPLLGTEMEQILADENVENGLVPVREAALMFQNGGFEKNIWLLPIEKLVEVAKTLYEARMQIKQVIYEITGLSDIIRGSSVASETATAQNLKNKWGSIRLRDMQKSVAGYVRDLYRLTVDAAAKNIPPEKWKAITQAPIPTESEKAVLQQQVAYSQAMQKPVPPQLLQQLQQPSLETLLKQISDDANRTYTINVQSDSTVDIDTATDKQEVQEFMNALGQMMPGLQPLVTLGPTGLEAAKQIVIAVCSRFKFGLSILDSIKALQAPPPQQNGPTPEQAQKEKDLAQQEEQLKGLLVKLEDTKRDIETQRKEFAADIKVFNAERAAQEKVAAANQQVQGAQAQAKEAQDKAVFVERKSELSSATAGLKANVRAAQKTQEAANPVLTQMTQVISQMAASVAELQKAVAQMGATQAKKPLRIERQGNSLVPVYE